VVQPLGGVEVHVGVADVLDDVQSAGVRRDRQQLEEDAGAHVAEGDAVGLRRQAAVEVVEHVGPVPVDDADPDRLAVVRRGVAVDVAQDRDPHRRGDRAHLRVRNLALPEAGWGELVLEESRPDAGREWTNSGRQRDQRQLKHRAKGETRRVPTPPELTALLQEHLARYGAEADGRVFAGDRGGELPSITYAKVWRRARERAFTPEVVASPLAARPYDLRHAAVSTWLNGGVPPTQVAEWAGHSVAVLLQVYAKCLVGQDAIARQRVEAALRQE
jgi:hypothetical protein